MRSHHGTKESALPSLFSLFVLWFVRQHQHDDKARERRDGGEHHEPHAKVLPPAGNESYEDEV